MGVQRVRRAGAALHRPAGNTEVPPGPPPGGAGLGTGQAAPASPAAWPRRGSPPLVTPRALALPARPAPHLASVSHLLAQEPSAARARRPGPLRARPRACVRAPESRARSRTTPSRARRVLPRLHPGRGRAGPGGAAPGWGEWLVLPARPQALECHLLSLFPSPQASRCRASAGSVWICS